MSCSMTRTDVPVAACTRWSSGPRASVSRWATPPDGSSSTMTAGIRGQQAGELHDAAGTGGQLAGELLAEGAEPHELDEQVDGASAHLGLARAGAGCPKASATMLRVTEVAFAGDGERLGGGEGGEQAGLLERAAEAAAGPLVRARAR